MKRIVQFKLNGGPVDLDTDDQRMLLWVLRTDLGFDLRPNTDVVRESVARAPWSSMAKRAGPA